MTWQLIALFRAEAVVALIQAVSREFRIRESDLHAEQSLLPLRPSFLTSCSLSEDFQLSVSVVLTYQDRFDRWLSRRFSPRRK